MKRTPDSRIATTVEFARYVEDAVRDYNTTRHRGVKTTPLAKWRACPSTVETVSDRRIALALLRREDVTVTRAGVELNGITYQGLATATHVGDTLEAGWLASHPEFVDLFDPARRESEQWLGRLQAMPAASDRLSGAIRDARTKLVETWERAEGRGRELRAAGIVQLRGGDVADPGAAPATTKRSPRPRGVPTPNEHRRARVAGATIWKETTE